MIYRVKSFVTQTARDQQWDIACEVFPYFLRLPSGYVLGSFCQPVAGSRVKMCCYFLMVFQKLDVLVT